MRAAPDGTGTLPNRASRACGVALAVRLTTTPWLLLLQTPPCADGCTGCVSPVQAATLPASLCCQLLVPLGTGMSEHAAIQQDADRLLSACCDRMASLLAPDATLAADAGMQATLLQFLGPLHDMLNSAARRGLFRRLPFALLQVLSPPPVQGRAACG